MSKKGLSIILTLFTLISMSVVVFAEVVKNVGGGRWEYDVNHNPGGVCSSRYYHPQVLHGSTAINGDDQKKVDCKVSAGRTSNAIVTSTPHGNKAYWHRCNIDRVCN